MIYCVVRQLRHSLSIRDFTVSLFSTSGSLDHRPRYLIRQSRRLIVLKKGKVIRGHKAVRKQFVYKLKAGHCSLFNLSIRSGCECDYRCYPTTTSPLRIVNQYLKTYFNQNMTHVTSSEIKRGWSFSQFLSAIDWKTNAAGQWRLINFGSS